jgi:hypothetical protein
MQELKPFQVQAAGALAAMIQEYPGPRFSARYDPDTGEVLPFLCRLRAITGAGKTPILAATANHLEDGIILWTTNRGAVISQTLANLRPDGKYGDLLPPDAEVFDLAEMAPNDWEAAMEATRGLTIALATVASFNQEGDVLKIHQPYGDSTRWKMLGGQSASGRKRPLYVFYDEGHGATERQFQKLRELKPTAFVLASASPLPEDLSDLLSGRTQEEREQSLRDRTVLVSTKEVVEVGLLKNRLYFVDCNTTQTEAVSEAQAKWNEIAAKLEPYDATPIACFIVNETVRGVDVWEHLTQKLGVPATQIAVHLNGAREVSLDRHGADVGLIDTYTGKSSADRSPQALRAAGYTHIIWNMTLREGWDEPLAYVAYIDDRGRSQVDMVQKIGRFVRQPNAEPFDDPDLNSAYFYFNVTDDDFTSLIRQTQEEMETEGYEVIGLGTTSSPPTSREVTPKQELTAPTIAITFGNSIEALDSILLDNVPMFHESALTAPGIVRTRVYDMKTQGEDASGRTEQVRASNDVTTVWQFLSSKLSEIDSRIVDRTGSRFSADIKDDAKMKQKVGVGSEAMQAVQRAVDPIRNALNDKIELVDLGRRGVYKVPPFKLIAPDISGVSDAQREKYRVRRYNNAAHSEYNGLNPFEVRVAEAIDNLGVPWCRNPVGKAGYRIPIPELGSDTIWFYPDFLIWTKTGVIAVDPKGNHLREAAVTQKLLDLSNVQGMRNEVKVALVLEGSYVMEGGTFVKTAGRGGYTLIRRRTTGPRADPFTSLAALFKALVPAS